MADIFSKQDISQQNPMTADYCTVQGLGGGESYATNVQVSYQQSITRRRTIGGQSNFAVIYGSLPQGQITMSRLAIGESLSSVGQGACWNACEGGQITLSLKGACEGAGEATFTCTGCVVTAYTVSLEADSLTVMDNVQIEFLQLKKT